MTEVKNNKGKIAYYLFAKDENGESQRIGTAFHHDKGKGLNIVIGDKRYTAFPPKPKAEASEA